MAGAPTDRTFSGFFAVLASAVACAFVLVAMPRPLLPRDLPPLKLARAEVEAQLRADRAAAKAAPSSREASELYEDYLEQGRSERLPGVERMAATASQEALIRYATAVFDGVGPDGVGKLRARALERYLLARAGALPDRREAEGLLGAFDKQLEKYGLVTASGIRLAPELSVRTLYKARWSFIHGLSPHDGLSQIELQAYEGWIALHAHHAPESRRLEAAREFQRAHGHHADEALALWLLKAGGTTEALALLEPLSAGGLLRARNYVLGVRALSE